MLGSQLSCTGGDQIIGNPFTIIKMFYGMSERERERERGSLKYETMNDLSLSFIIGLALVYSLLSVCHSCNLKSITGQIYVSITLLERLVKAIFFR